MLPPCQVVPKPRIMLPPCQVIPKPSLPGERLPQRGGGEPRSWLWVEHYILFDLQLHRSVRSHTLLWRLFFCSRVLPPCLLVIFSARQGGVGVGVPHQRTESVTWCFWCFYSFLISLTLSEIWFVCSRSADHSPNKIILTEQKLEERKRWVNYVL